MNSQPISNTSSTFGNTSGSSGTSGTSSGYGLSEFMNSNSLVAKFAFLLFVIFVFVLVLQASIAVMGRVLNPSDNEKLITGMVDAKQLLVIPQDPSQTGAKTINRSVNATDGIEFTWSVWIFINDLGNTDNKYKHIFHKGNDSTNDVGLNYPNNAPGLYISPNTNELTVIMNTYDVINEEVTVPNIPIGKWVNVIIRCKNNTMDIYINGTATKSVRLIGVPKQNYGDVYVAMNGGFDGYISNLWYYNYSLGTTAIQKIVKKGPNKNMTGNPSMNMKNPNYLSLRWYFYGNNDEYNP
jgi:predicted secreted protein